MSWDEFFLELDWFQLLEESKVINNSIELILMAQEKNKRIAILTKIHTLGEMQAKTEILRSEKIEIPILFVPPHITKSQIYIPKHGETLIDDSIKNLREWQRCGGKSIYFNEQGNESHEFESIKTLKKFYKGCEAIMIDDELLNNYKKSLSQKYHAVCLDIDGTLTETNSIKIDERVLPVLASLLKKRIPVVFITGRGETGLLQLKRDIIIKLQQDFGITYKQFRGMYALTNDGARLFSTKKSDYEIFDNSQYTTSPTKLHSLKMLDNKLIEELKSKGLLDYCKITYSRDLRTDTILNIRIAPQDNQEKKSKIIATIQHLLSLPESNNINLTVGMYHGNQIFQIGTTVKSNAIKTVEKIIGIPENSMLRLGDCGNEEGNDYTMLNCSQGFSVDKTSSSKDKCFPVINENGEILSGVDATIFLLNKAKLLPTICLEHATESDYTKSYSKIEKEMILGRNKRISVFNDIVNTKFNVNDGIYDLYDKFSGSMKIPLYEWINIDDDNPLKIF